MKLDVNVIVMSTTLLLSLPNELLINIISFIHDKNTLIELAVTCSRLYVLAEPFLYRSVLLLYRAQTTALAKSLATSSISTSNGSSFPQPAASDCIPASRRAAMHELDIRINPEEVQNLEDFTPMISRLPNLCSLTIESPFCNHQNWLSDGYMKCWTVLLEGYRQMFDKAAAVINGSRVQGTVEDRGLGALRSLTLHWNGRLNEYWDLNEASSVLLLPCLRDLTLSSAIITESINHLLPFKGSTALKCLNLIECEMNRDGLITLFALPRALESAYIGLAQYGSSGTVLYHACCIDVITAIQQQQNSLENLGYNVPEGYADRDDRIYPRSRVPDEGLSSLTQLRTLTIECGAALIFSIISSYYAPPNLAHLRIYSSDRQFFDQETEIPEHNEVSSVPEAAVLSEYLPRLKDFTIVIDGFRKRVPQWFWSHPYRRELATKMGEDYKKRGIVMSVSVVISAGSFVPPYLYGEGEPREEVVYVHGSMTFPSHMVDGQGDPEGEINDLYEGSEGGESDDFEYFDEDFDATIEAYYMDEDDEAELDNALDEWIEG